MITTIAKRGSLILTLWASVGLACAESELKLLWETEGFKNPESVAYDSMSNQLFVSNIDGVPTRLDAQGGTAKVSMDGEILDDNWAAIGMSSPAGVLAHDGRLYVADVDRLVVFDIESHYVVDIFYAKPSGKFLNDVVLAPNGDIYVSDLKARDIWRLRDERFVLWLDGKSSSFCRPNGLQATEDALIVACWTGKKSAGQKEGEEPPGQLVSISYEDKQVKPLGENLPAGNLDGLQSDGADGYFVSDWVSGKLMHWTPDSGTRTIAELEPGIADFLIIPEHNMLVVPFMKDNRVRAYQYPLAQSGSD